MRCTRWGNAVGGALLATVVLVGCHGGETTTLKYFGDRDLQHYRDVALQQDFPVENESRQVPETKPPHRLRDRSRDEVWDLTLQDAIRIALENATFLRTRNAFLSPANTLLLRPDSAPSVFDPAIQSTGFLFNQRGVEAALSDFDAQISASMTWGRDERVSESRNIGFFPGDARIEETGRFRSQIQKTFAHSGIFSVQHNWDYSGLNNQFGGNRLFPSHFTSPGPNTPTLGFTYRQPLLAGAGTEFTRIAGPRGNVLNGVSGVAQGVMIARINEDISLTDFRIAVRDMIKDVEDAYWDLYLAYRTYDSEVMARNSALRTWREVRAKLETGSEGGGSADEAQARDNYYELRARAEDALHNIYFTELQLRRLLGLPVNDGKIIRPTDEPVAAAFEPDWRVALVEALTYRDELTRQKWAIKSFELQQKAAKNLTRPQLDFVSSYYINGFGDVLLGPSNGQRFHSAYQTLLNGSYTGWTLGFQFAVPLGLRAAHTQLRNIELRLAKARAALTEQEREIALELAFAYQNLSRYYQLAQTNFNRRRAAERRMQAFEAEYKAGRTTLDLYLRSQISLAQAEIAYYNAITNYNKALNEFRYRKGTLLRDNNIHLEEGLWDPEAYIFALRRAWARTYAFDAESQMDTKPEEIALCPVCRQLFLSGASLSEHMDAEHPDAIGAPAPADGETPPQPPRPHDTPAEAEAGDAAPPQAADRTALPESPRRVPSRTAPTASIDAGAVDARAVYVRREPNDPFVPPVVETAQDDLAGMTARPPSRRAEAFVPPVRIAAPPPSTRVAARTREKRTPARGTGGESVVPARSGGSSDRDSVVPAELLDAGPDGHEADSDNGEPKFLPPVPVSPR